MGLFGKKEEAAQPLAQPATIVLTVNSIPANPAATYWYEVDLNGSIVGNIGQNGVPTAFTTGVDKNTLSLLLNIRDSKGQVTKYPSPKQKLDLASGETVQVLHANRKFTVSKAG